MISNMAMRQTLINHGDHIIKNNQEFATGNCSNIIKINKSSELQKTPYILNNLYNYFTLEHSDIKNKYLSDYMYASVSYNTFINIK